RHAKVHLVSVDSARVPNRPEHLRRFSVDSHINGRIDYGEGTRGKRLTGGEARARRSEAGGEEGENLAGRSRIRRADEREVLGMGDGGPVGSGHHRRPGHWDHVENRQDVPAPVFAPVRGILCDGRRTLGSGPRQENASRASLATSAKERASTADNRK